MKVTTTVMRTTVAIDFDGVIHSYHMGWCDGSIYGTEITGAFNSLRLLLKDYNVFIFSSRKPAQIEAWMEEHMPEEKFEVIDKDLHFWNKKGVIGITNRKLPAAVYIDDRALKFTDWRRAMEKVEMRMSMK